MIIHDHHLIKGSRVITLDKLTSTDIYSILISKVENKPSPNIYYENLFIGCVRYIFANWFLGLNESNCQIKKNVFYFTSKPLSIFEKIKF